MPKVFRCANIIISTNLMLVFLSITSSAVELDNSWVIERNKFYENVTRVKFEFFTKQFDQTSKEVRSEWRAKFESDIFENLNQVMAQKYTDSKIVLTRDDVSSSQDTVVAKIDINVSPPGVDYNNVQVTITISKNGDKKGQKRNVRAVPTLFYRVNFQQTELSETEQRVLLSTIWPGVSGLPRYLNTRK
jgi:hypothetical protein